MQDTITAIALHYDPSADSAAAPRVAAAGQGHLAEEILRIARDNDIPLRRDPSLAEALATLDVGSQIPPDLFRAVAEVLAFVYKINGKA